jgi:translation initiation factor 1
VQSLGAGASGRGDLSETEKVFGGLEFGPLAERRTVYSTEKGWICPGCGWPAQDCRCSKTIASRDEAVPAKVTAQLRLENRVSGKHVTVVDGLPKNAAYLAELLAALKKACGTGGRAGEGSLELQGDQRERLRDLLARRGLAVKG